MQLHTAIQSLTLALCVTLSTLAFVQAQDKPGIMLGDAVVMTTKVEAIDLKDRAVALQGPEGNVFVVEVDDAVKNFKQIKVGDQVRVESYEAVTVYFGKAGEQPVEDAEAIVATAPKGQEPGGMAIGAVDVSATVRPLTAPVRTCHATGSASSRLHTHEARGRQAQRQRIVLRVALVAAPVPPCCRYQCGRAPRARLANVAGDATISQRRHLV
jgi:hypothetical protein